MKIIELYKQLEEGPKTDPHNLFGDFMLKKNLWVGRILIPLGLIVLIIGIIIWNLIVILVGLGISMAGILALIIRRYFMPEGENYKPSIFDDVLFSIGALVGLGLGIWATVLLFQAFTGSIEMQTSGYIFYFVILLAGFYGFWEDFQKVKKHIKNRNKK